MSPAKVKARRGFAPLSHLKAFLDLQQCFALLPGDPAWLLAATRSPFFHSRLPAAAERWKWTRQRLPSPAELRAAFAKAKFEHVQAS